MIRNHGCLYALPLTLWAIVSSCYGRREMSINYKIHPVLADITARIVRRSAESRRAYLDNMYIRRPRGLARKTPSPLAIKPTPLPAVPYMTSKHFSVASWPNIGIVTSYNDMLSAHKTVLKLIPGLSAKLRVRPARLPKWRAACLPCATALRRARTGWNCLYFPVTSLPCPRRFSLSHDVFDARAISGHLR